MNVTAFFCDIRGTFEWELGEEYLVKNFTKKLSDLRKANKSDKLIFSFVTNDGPEYLDKYLNYLKANINDEKIIFGKQFFLDGYSYNGQEYKTESNLKGITIINSLKELEATSNVTNVYYADYATFYCNTLRLACKKFPEYTDKVTIINSLGLRNLVGKIDEIVEKSKIQRNDIKSK